MEMCKCAGQPDLFGPCQEHGKLWNYTINGEVVWACAQHNDYIRRLYEADIERF